ncbi:MAG: hypothetical protein GX100_02200 [candidate division WS1 bacterium]|nr:hypothetical protein [candidate division WS1 bacterium]
MSTLSVNLAFAGIILVALGLMTAILSQVARALGHSPSRIQRRLAVLWLSVLLAVVIGLVLRWVFPGGLFQVNFAHGHATSWFVLSGRGAGVFLVVGLLAMALCAALGLWAIRALQRPAEDSESSAESQKPLRTANGAETPPMQTPEAHRPPLSPPPPPPPPPEGDAS